MLLFNNLHVAWSILINADFHERIIVVHSQIRSTKYSNNNENITIKMLSLLLATGIIVIMIITIAVTGQFNRTKNVQTEICIET